MENKKLYRLTNKAKDTRNFFDKYLGKNIQIQPKKFILTYRPPEENEIWKVEDVEELEKKKQQLNKREVKKI
jgi:hypothetical protein